MPLILSVAESQYDMWRPPCLENSRTKRQGNFMDGTPSGYWHRPMRGRTLRSASRAFIPPWSPACFRGTVGSRTSQLSRARNPSRQRQEALRRSLLSREDVAIRVPPRIGAWSAGESRNSANACLAKRHRNQAAHRGGARMPARSQFSRALRPPMESGWRVSELYMVSAGRCAAPGRQPPGESQ